MMALGYLPVIKHQTVYRVLNIRYTENTIATFNYGKTQNYEQRLEVKSNYVYVMYEHMKNVCSSSSNGIGYFTVSRRSEWAGE